jgi:hypothetical protein
MVISTCLVDLLFVLNIFLSSIVSISISLSLFSRNFAILDFDGSVPSPFSINRPSNFSICSFLDIFVEFIFLGILLISTLVSIIIDISNSYLMRHSFNILRNFRNFSSISSLSLESLVDLDVFLDSFDFDFELSSSSSLDFFSSVFFDFLEGFSSINSALNQYISHNYTYYLELLRLFFSSLMILHYQISLIFLFLSWLLLLTILLEPLLLCYLNFLTGLLLLSLPKYCKMRIDLHENVNH